MRKRIKCYTVLVLSINTLPPISGIVKNNPDEKEQKDPLNSVIENVKKLKLWSKF